MNAACNTANPSKESGAPLSSSDHESPGARTRRGTINAPNASQFSVTRAQSAKIDFTHASAARLCSGAGSSNLLMIPCGSATFGSRSAFSNGRDRTDPAGFFRPRIPTGISPGINRAQALPGCCWSVALSAVDGVSARPERLCPSTPRNGDIAATTTTSCKSCRESGTRDRSAQLREAAPVRRPTTF